MFDFDAAIKEAASPSKHLVGAVVLGCSGSGKSRLMGTFPGKVLYLHTTGEDHGVTSAKTVAGDDVDPLCIDFTNGKKLTGDEAYARLLSILESKDALKKRNYAAIALDGATEIEAIIRSTTAFKNACLSAKGNHNAFAEPAATVTLFRPIIAYLKDLQRSLGVHYAMTCILDVKEYGSDGAIVDAMPRLTGFSVAESVIQQFGDVLVVGPMVRNDQKKYKFQFMSDIHKTSKDEDGRVKKTLNFNPRISGFENLPPFVEADFKEIIKLKGDKK